MIALKSLQYMDGLLSQEELLRAIAGHYVGMVSDKKLVPILENIIKTSRKNTEDILNYIESHK